MHIKWFSGVFHLDATANSDNGFHLSVRVPRAHQNVGSAIWHRDYVSISLDLILYIFY